MRRFRKLVVQLCAVITVASCLAAAPVVAGTSGGIGVGADDSSSAVRGGAFPIKGPHTYGDGLGAGRGHQGQDLLAKCGKPVVAARAGRVRVVDYQGSGAGNYVVVKGRESRPDFVYMHMLRRAKVSRGQRVRAGQLLGRVGSTGRSSACHLHFEMWAAPGWYRGGDVKNPTPLLKHLDRQR